MNQELAALILIVLVYGIGPGFILWEAYFSYNAKRRNNPGKWDISGIRFHRDMDKFEFYKAYPLYPGGGHFHVEFEDDKSYKVKSIIAITNSGVRSIAVKKRTSFFDNIKPYYGPEWDQD